MKKLSVLAAGAVMALFVGQAMAGDYYDYDEGDGYCAPPVVHYRTVVKYHEVPVIAGYHTVRTLYSVPVVTYRTVVRYHHVPVYANLIYRTLHRYPVYSCCD